MRSLSTLTLELVAFNVIVKVASKKWGFQALQLDSTYDAIRAKWGRLDCRGRLAQTENLALHAIFRKKVTHFSLTVHYVECSLSQHNTVRVKH